MRRTLYGTGRCPAAQPHHARGGNTTGGVLVAASLGDDMVPLPGLEPGHTV